MGPHERLPDQELDTDTGGLEAAGVLDFRLVLWRFDMFLCASLKKSICWASDWLVHTVTSGPGTLGISSGPKVRDQQDQSLFSWCFLLVCSSVLWVKNLQQVR